MQNAETTLAIIRDHWRAVCGESCKHGSGGGSWKRPARDLARSLPHWRACRWCRTEARKMTGRSRRTVEVSGCQREFWDLTRVNREVNHQCVAEDRPHTSPMRKRGDQ